MAAGDDETEPIDILLIEPSQGDTRLFTESFEEASITNSVHAVCDGDEALAFVQNDGAYASAPEPDVVLLEPRLPGSDAADLLSRLYETNGGEELPVVVLTSSDAEEDILRSQELEADAFIQKPVETDEFVEFVQSVEDFWLTIVRRSVAE